jgi:Flp pilus assembly protein TadD
MQLARLMVTAACLIWLAGCESLPNVAQPSDSTASIAAGSADAGLNTNGATLGSDPNDDLSLGKRHYREQNYGLAEKHFRRAVEAQPRTAEAWVGLAASYDRLRRFDLADRAYDQATAILGPTPEILNNQGYSYMLRGDYKMARKKLAAAQTKDPDSKYIQNNLELLDEISRKGKGLR